MAKNIWKTIYERNEQLNRYPFSKIVSFVYKYYDRKKPKKETRILEVGFGSGCNLWFCAREGFDCYGVEAEPIAVEYAKNWFKQEGLSADLKEGNFYPLNFEADFFDMVIDRGSLSCVNFQESLESLKEINRVLKKDGCFFFNPYSSKHTSCVEGKIDISTGMTNIKTGTIANSGELKFYDCKEIEQLVKDTGFQIEYLKHIEEIYLHSEIGKHCEWEVLLRK